MSNTVPVEFTLGTLQPSPPEAAPVLAHVDVLVDVAGVQFLTRGWRAQKVNGGRLGVFAPCAVVGDRRCSAVEFPAELFAAIKQAIAEAVARAIPSSRWAGGR